MSYSFGFNKPQQPRCGHLAVGVVVAVLFCAASSGQMVACAAPEPGGDAAWDDAIVVGGSDAGEANDSGTADRAERADGAVENCVQTQSCPQDTVCCPAGMPCAGECVPDCRLGVACPPQVPVCRDNGLCGPEPIDAGPGADAGGDASAVDGPAQVPSDWHSAFGVFAVFTGEFSVFAQAGGWTLDQYMQWAGTEMQQLGARWTRSNLQLIWDFVEPEIGAGYDWDNTMGTERAFGAAQQAGVHYLAVFYEGGLRDSRAGAPPTRNPYDDLPAYLQFVRAAVERYDGDGVDDAPNGMVIKHWQVGNESMAFTDNVSTYVTWFTDVAAAVRQADPEAKVFMTASLSGNTIDELHRQALTQLSAAGVSVDGIDLHHWGGAGNIEMRAVPGYQELFAELGMQDVELWSTEHGTYVGRYDSASEDCSPQCNSSQVCVRAGTVDTICVPACSDDTMCPTPAPSCDISTGVCGQMEQDEASQARSLIKRYVVNRDLGVKRIMWNNLASWHCFGGTCGGIFDRIGLVSGGFLEFETSSDWGKRRLSWYAYQQLASRSDEMFAERLGRLDVGDPTVYVSRYRSRANGRMGYVVWGENSGRVDLPMQGASADLTGLITDSQGVALRQEQLSAVAGQVEVSYDVDPVWVQENP